jgi:hypothetical protein
MEGDRAPARSIGMDPEGDLLSHGSADEEGGGRLPQKVSDV